MGALSAAFGHVKKSQKGQPRQHPYCVKEPKGKVKPSWGQAVSSGPPCPTASPLPYGSTSARPRRESPQQLRRILPEPRRRRSRVKREVRRPLAWPVKLGRPQSQGSTI